MAFFTLLIAGALAGVLGALLGLGGGVFLVPALTLFFDMPMRVAVGVSLVGVIATSAGVAAVARPGRGADVSLALRLEMLTAAGAMLGGWLAGRVSPKTLYILFAVVSLATALYLFYRSRQQAQSKLGETLFTHDYSLRHWPAGLAASSVAGMLSGLLGMGCGFIKVPVMYALMEVPLGVATATSNFMVGITAAASVFIYYGRGDIHPLVAIPTVLGVFGGAMIGVYLQPRLRVSWLRLALIALLLYMGAQMLVQGWQL